MTDKEKVLYAGLFSLVIGLLFVGSGFRQRNALTVLLGLVAVVAGLMLVSASSIGFNHT